MMGPDPSSTKILSEAKWISMELHDGLLPWVVSAKMQLERLTAGTDHRETTAETIASSIQTLNSALLEGRELIRVSG